MGLLNKVFFKVGYYSASNPCTSMFFALAVTIVCSLGFINYKVTVRNSPNSYPSIYRAAPKSFGSLPAREPTSSKIISMSSLAPSSESTPSSSALNSKTTQMLISSKSLTWNFCSISM